MAQVLFGRGIGHLRQTVLEAGAAWLWPDWRGEYIGKRVGPKTRRRRVVFFPDILEVLGNRPVCELGPADVIRLQAHCKRRGLSNGSTNVVTHGVLFAFVRDLEMVGAVDGGAHLRILATEKLPDDTDRLPPFTIEERERAIEAFPEGHWRTIASLLFLTGLRIGEAAGLEDSDIHWPSKSLVIKQSRDGTLETYGKNSTAHRTLMLPDRLVDPLLALRGRGEAYFLPGRYGRGVMNCQSFRVSVWYPALERAGLRHLRPHYARHTYAHIAIRDGGQSIEEVAAQLGDTVATVQKTYAHLLPPRDPNKAIGQKPPPDSSPPTAVQVVRERARAHLRVVK